MTDEAKDCQLVLPADWKLEHCGRCEFWIPGERPRQLVQGKAGVLMDGPRQGTCRRNPPSIVPTGTQQTAQGMGLILQAFYPPCSDGNPACSRFVKALALVEA